MTDTRESESKQPAERPVEDQMNNPGRTPDKSEGDEKTVDEALRHQEDEKGDGKR
ncbi:MAG TPA: hypothetical protein VNM92_12490 [Thermoanaerobaculia bacterium]|nr:hypothetical protein [Thermoanaerobaculia bacterium]